MKIAYLTTCFGTQSHTFIRREIRALREQGVDIALLGIRKDDGNLAPDGADLVAETRYLYPLQWGKILSENARSLARGPGAYFKGLWEALASEEFSLARRLKMGYHYVVAAAFVADVRELGITHIHSHFMNVSTSIAMYTAHHARLPFSATVHSAGTFRTPSILGMHQKVRRAQGLVMISHYNVDYIDAIEPCRHKATVIRCGMDMDNFEFRDPAKHTPGAPPKLVAVGRFVEKKGFTHLLDAAHRLKAANVAFSLDVIGTGPLDQSLRQQAKTLELAPEVSFVGFKSTAEVRAAMDAADLVIVPSVTCSTGEKEGLPVVIMEAMATGVPVVATEHSGIPEIVRQADTGWLVPEKDAEALAAAITSALQTDARARVAAARELVDQEFNIDTVATQRKALFARYAEAVAQ